MGGYRAQIRKACRQLGRRRKPFDYTDVLGKIPDGPYKPYGRQIIRELMMAKYLEVAEKGDKNRGKRTRYRLRRRARR